MNTLAIRSSSFDCLYTHALPQLLELDAIPPVFEFWVWGLAGLAAQIDEIAPVLHADERPDVVHKEIGL